MRKQVSFKYLTLIFFISYLFFLLIELFLKSSPWMYDTMDYWTRGKSLAENQFRLNSINGFRGYVYPLYLAIIYSLGGKVAWYILNPAVFSVLLVFFLYEIYGKNEDYKKFSIGVVVLTIFIGILYAGAIAFPLSDFIALICMCISLFFFDKTISEQGNRNFIYAILVGVFSYFSYNIRTIYLFSLLSIYVIYIIICLQKKNNIFLTVGFAVGNVIAGIPQSIMNYCNLGKFTFSVPTDGLMLHQMYWGIQYQRYDTYISFEYDLAHLTPQVKFVDPAGMDILSKMQLTTFSTWGDYIKVLVHYPLDIIAVYVRHFINFVFPCWPQMYVQNLNSLKWPLGLFGITILFLGVYIILSKCYKESKWLWLFTPILIPSILIIPGAVEYRFSIGIYFYILLNICFNTNWKELKDKVYKDKLKIIFVYLGIVLLCVAIWSSMLAMEEQLPLSL